LGVGEGRKECAVQRWGAMMESWRGRGIIKRGGGSMLSFASPHWTFWVCANRENHR
jgi:hypothetical protein